MLLLRRTVVAMFHVQIWQYGVSPAAALLAALQQIICCLMGYPITMLWLVVPMLTQNVAHGILMSQIFMALLHRTMR